MNPGKLFIVSAPSGAGKTSLVTHAIDHLKRHCPIERVITYTTKEPRAGEQHGQDYYFISQPEFLSKIEEGFFIEYSTDYGHYYGTPRYLLDQVSIGKSYVAVIDRAGAKKIKENTVHAVLIWIDIESIEILEKRLLGRNTENDEQLKKRLFLAQEEILAEKKEKLYEHRIINDVFEKALLELVSIIGRTLGLAQEMLAVKKN